MVIWGIAQQWAFQLKFTIASIECAQNVTVENLNVLVAQLDRAELLQMVQDRADRISFV